MTYGYIRVSTDKQETANQRFEIENFARQNKMVIDYWVEETISSRRDIKQRKLYPLLNQMAKGDLMIACELSRLGRNLMQIMSILHGMLEKECCIWTIKDNYRLGNDISSKVLAFAFGLSAEIERNLISQRTTAALARRKSEGVVLGRPLGSNSQVKKLDAEVEKLKFYLEKGLTYSAIGRLLGANRLTVASACKRHGLKMLRPVSPTCGQHMKGKYAETPISGIPDEELLQEFRSTVSLVDMGKKYGLTSTALSTLLKRRGLYNEIKSISTQQRIKVKSKNQLRREGLMPNYQ